MNKKGFTLIELMVVVVIIGILAAVAVPKLFGMIAKSKASEVGPAAGTYVKMQQAYISESMMMGNWVIIGYKGPGATTDAGLKSNTTNFDYEDKGEYTTANNMAAPLPSEAATGWSAKNKAKLNDCASNDDNWTVTVEAQPGTDAAAGEAKFTADTQCAELTPTFNTIGN